MNQFISLTLSLIFISLSICSCKSMTPDASKRAYCNMLKSNLVFNGSTGVTREANIENSESPMNQRTFDAEKCAEQ